MKTTTIEKIRRRDKRLKYPKSIFTLELTKTQGGDLIIHLTHERFPDAGLVYQTFKTVFFVDSAALKRLGPTDRMKVERDAFLASLDQREGKGRKI